MAALDDVTPRVDSPLTDEAVEARRVDDFASDESTSSRRPRWPLRGRQW